MEEKNWSRPLLTRVVEAGSPFRDFDGAIEEALLDSDLKRNNFCPHQVPPHWIYALC